MAELDLRALSAPLNQLKDDLKKAYQKLDKQWAQITNCLCESPIPTSVGYHYGTSPDDDELYYLQWRKLAGKWRICKTRYALTADEYGEPTHEEIDVVPIEEWSGSDRLDMLKHVPGLFDEAARTTKQFISEALS